MSGFKEAICNVCGYHSPVGRSKTGRWVCPVCQIVDRDWYNK